MNCSCNFICGLSDVIIKTFSQSVRSVGHCSGLLIYWCGSSQILGLLFRTSVETHFIQTLRAQVQAYSISSHDLIAICKHTATVLVTRRLSASLLHSWTAQKPLNVGLSSHLFSLDNPQCSSFFTPKIVDKTKISNILGSRVLEKQLKYASKVILMNFNTAFNVTKTLKKRTCTWWAKTAGPQPHDHNSVQS